MTHTARVTGYHNAHAALCDKRLVQSMYSECNVLMERVLLNQMRYGIINVVMA